jgi:hypothetical protein
MSGRNIKDICEHAERRYASKVISTGVNGDNLPTLADYIGVIKTREDTLQEKQKASKVGFTN